MPLNKETKTDKWSHTHRDLEMHTHLYLLDAVSVLGIL